MEITKDSPVLSDDEILDGLYRISAQTDAVIHIEIVGVEFTIKPNQFIGATNNWKSCAHISIKNDPRKSGDDGMLHLFYTSMKRDEQSFRALSRIATNDMFDLLNTPADDL